jgi:outer membrane lipoprotein carrier protein
MNMRYRRLLRVAAFFVAFGVHPARSDGLKDLEEFVKTAKTGRASFTQTVTAPPKDGKPARVKHSSGSFEFARPGQFRFAYRKPFEQTIVADGQTLWLHDADLNQVTRRVQAKALGATPAALITTATDLKALQADFNVANAPDADGQSWVVATPKSRDGQVQSVRMGFRDSALSSFEILDSFGQISRLQFSGWQLNAAMDAATFQFKPPAGADVVKQ